MHVFLLITFKNSSWLQSSSTMYFSKIANSHSFKSSQHDLTAAISYRFCFLISQATERSLWKGQLSKTRWQWLHVEIPSWIGRPTRVPQKGHKQIKKTSNCKLKLLLIYKYEHYFMVWKTKNPQLILIGGFLFI